MSVRIAFATPPFGLEPLDDFTLAEVDGANGLFTLTAEGVGDAGVGGADDDGAEQEAPRLFVLDAAVHLPDYSPVVNEEQSALLDLHDAADALLLVVANPAEGGTTVNLLAPIVVNARTGVGAQVILDGQDFPLRAVLSPR